MKARILLLLVTLFAAGQAQAWIAYGFKSGMSRFSVEGYLADDSTLVVTGAEAETFAGPENSRTLYHLVYCSSPQILYRMKFRLLDTHDEFVATKTKFERRYGTPESSGDVVAADSSEDWQNTDVSLIWSISDTETILLEHDRDGTTAEFQDVSVCQ